VNSAIPIIRTTAPTINEINSLDGSGAAVKLSISTITAIGKTDITDSTSLSQNARIFHLRRFSIKLKRKKIYFSPFISLNKYHDSRRYLPEHKSSRDSNVESTETLIPILASSLGFFTPPYARTLVILLFTEVSEYAGLSATTLESAQGAVKGLIFFDSYFRQFVSPPFQTKEDR
jgi:hypothetical protein